MARGTRVPVSDTAMPIRGAQAATAAPTLRRAAPFCLAVFCVARVAMSALGVAVVRDHPPDISGITAFAPPTPYIVPATPGWHNAVDGMQRWDAGWFSWIAADGYGSGSGQDAGARIAFFPAFPALEAAAAAATGLGTPAAGVVVSNLAYLASLIALFLLTAAELGERNARWATAFFVAMPTSFFLLAPYSESLFLLLTLLAFLWARRSRWGPTLRRRVPRRTDASDGHRARAGALAAAPRTTHRSPPLHVRDRGSFRGRRLLPGVVGHLPR